MAKRESSDDDDERTRVIVRSERKEHALLSCPNNGGGGCGGGVLLNHRRKPSDRERRVEEEGEEEEREEKTNESENFNSILHLLDMEYIELNSSCADSEASRRLAAKSEGEEALSSEGCGSIVGMGESLSAAGRLFPLSRTFSA